VNGRRRAAPTELVSFLAPYPAQVRDLFLAGRSLLLRRLRPVVEMHYDATSAVGAGFAYTGDLKGLFVNLAAFSDHVTLVFAWGVKLKDRERRLRGEGNQVRHMRLASLESLCDPYVLDLVDQASANAPRPEGKVKNAIIVKVYKGPKRRPKPEKLAKAVKPARAAKAKSKPRLT
jgi:hypothetical protein